MNLIQKSRVCPSGGAAGGGLHYLGPAATTVRGDANVNSNGTAVYAYARTTTTVNNVTITAVNNYTNSGNKIGLKFFNGYYGAFGTNSGLAIPCTNLSTACKKMIFCSGDYGPRSATREPIPGQSEFLVY